MGAEKFRQTMQALVFLILCLGISKIQAQVELEDYEISPELNHLYIEELEKVLERLEEEEEGTEKRGFDSSVLVQPQWVKKSSELEKMQYLLDRLGLKEKRAGRMNGLERGIMKFHHTLHNLIGR